jgi:hypothetical protein
VFNFSLISIRLFIKNIPLELNGALLFWTYLSQYGENMFLQNVHARPHGVTFQETSAFIFMDVRSSNLKRNYEIIQSQSFQHVTLQTIKCTEIF